MHAERMRASSGRSAKIWMFVGAATFGLTIWCMHFTGMVAFHLPIELNYDLTLTLLSVIPALISALLGFYILRSPVVNHIKLLIAAILMGSGIAMMHYTGMAALKMSPSINYSNIYFGLSIAIAIVAAWASLVIVLHANQLKLATHVRLILSSIIMGLAISSMHYTAMLGLGFAPNSVCLAASGNLDRNILVVFVVLISMFWFGGGLLAALFDQRIARRDVIALKDLQKTHDELEIRANRKAIEMTYELRKSETRANALIQSSLDCIISMNSDGHIIEFNPASEKTFGYLRKDILGKHFLSLIPKRFHKECIAGTERYLATGESNIVNKRTEQIAERANGKEFTVEVVIVHTQYENEMFFSAFIRDLTNSKEAEEEIYRLAFYDPLTKLPNRRLMQDRLQHAIKSQARHNQYGAIIFIDLDNFKMLNDTRGHNMGDLLLIETASRINASVRKNDTVARLGGDEFVVILEGLSEDSKQALLVAHVVSGEISLTLMQPYHLLEQEHYSTASIGVSLFQSRKSAQRVTVEDLLKRADTAMYQAKRAGRNTVRFFDPVMQADLEARSLLEKDLREAIVQGQLSLHYQPQVNQLNQIVGAEALIRWTHPERGAVSPAEFIPLSEDTGLILPISNWVLETACNQLKAWEKQAETANLVLAVNVSARQFRQPDFIDNLMFILRTSKINPNKLKLELTESLVLENVDDSIQKMQALIKMGIQFSMDDFGTGYSSLTYLKRLPLAQLKIDQSFVRDLNINKNDEAIVKSILVLAQTLNIDVVAEGVETEAQHAFLSQNGCHLFQGYLFGKPMPAHAFDAHLHNSLINKFLLNYQPA